MHNRYPYFYDAVKLSQASYDFTSPSLIIVTATASRLMPATADERCAGANICASVRNTVRVHRRLQRTGVQSYHRRRQQQMHSRMRRCVAYPSTFIDASTNVRMYAQKCVNACVSVNASTTRLCAFTDAVTETSLSAHL